jgi:probable phosphoglycerate mutase
MSQTPIHIYLARHGETRVGRDSLYLPDSGLTPTGHEQARELARALALKGIEMTFTSGMPRAQQTAAHYAEQCGIQASPLDALNEIDSGDIYSAPPEEKARIISHNHNLDFTEYGGEEPASFTKRVVAGFDEMVARAKSSGADTIAAFIHGGTIAVIIDHLAQVPFDYMRRRRMPNCAYVLVDAGAGKMSPHVEWQQAHLSILT